MPQATRGRRSKQRIGSGFKPPPGISQTPPVETSHRMRRCRRTPLSPTGPWALIAGSETISAASGTSPWRGPGEPRGRRGSKPQQIGTGICSDPSPASGPACTATRLVFQGRMGSARVLIGRPASQWKRCSSRPLAVSTLGGCEGGAAGAVRAHPASSSSFLDRALCTSPELRGFPSENVVVCTHLERAKRIVAPTPRGRRCPLQAGSMSQVHEDGPALRNPSDGAPGSGVRRKAVALLWMAGATGVVFPSCFSAHDRGVARAGCCVDTGCQSARWWRTRSAGS